MASKILMFTKWVAVNDEANIDFGRLKEAWRTTNQTEWRGHEPGSCKVTNLHSASVPGRGMRQEIEVTYRTIDFISFASGAKWHGWTPMTIKSTPEGELLNAAGAPLKENEPFVFVAKGTLPTIDYNDLDFGELTSELPVEGVKTEDAESIRKEIMASGHFDTSIKAGFSAIRRNRPYAKIILSTQPSQRVQDGFGTELRFLSLRTKHFELALMDEVTTLVQDFLEGRVSLHAVRGKTSDPCLLPLASTLVDCEPNEYGQESIFDCFHVYTPVTFLQDLALQLMATYELKVSVIEGKDCGLVLRREAH